MVKRFLGIVVLMSALVMAGCMDSKPSESQMAQQIESALDAGLHYIEVVDLEKKNGVKHDENHYTADLVFTIKFTKSFKDVEQQIKTDAEKNPTEAMQSAMLVIALAMAFGEFKAGEVVPVENSLNFIKSDNGWILAADENNPIIPQELIMNRMLKQSGGN